VCHSKTSKMLPHAEMETVFGKEAVQFTVTAIMKTVGFTEIAELRNLEKELYTVTEKWGFHRKRTEEAEEILRKQIQCPLDCPGELWGTGARITEDHG